LHTMGHLSIMRAEWKCLNPDNSTQFILQESLLNSLSEANKNASYDLRL